MVIVGACTVDKLLFTEVPELAELEQVVRLEGPHRRERPAAPAVTLVLHGRHSPHVTPVPMHWQVLQLILLILHCFVVGG